MTSANFRGSLAFERPLYAALMGREFRRYTAGQSRLLRGMTTTTTILITK